MNGELERLSDRERQALRLLGRGHEAKSIAATLDLSIHTVNERLRAARRKLGVSSSREAARLLLAHDAALDATYNPEPKEIGVAQFSPHEPHQESGNSRRVYATIGAVMFVLVTAALLTVPTGTDPNLAPGPRPVRALMSLPSLFAASDFPADALAAGAQGGTQFRLTVGVNGRVEKCAVVRSSGSASLDATTCRVITSRARFQPAVDDGGRPVPAVHTGTIKWVQR